MAGLNAPEYMTLTDVAKQCHNQELLNMVDQIGHATTLLNAMPWKQSSDALRDVTGVITAYPEAEYVGLDLGTKAKKANWTQKEEGLAMLEIWTETNEKTYQVSPNGDMIRWNNDSLAMKSVGMLAEEGLVYGNPANNQNHFLGFMPRFNKVTDFKRVSGGAKYDYCTLSCSGNTANSQSSILLVAKGGMAPQLLYPRYSANNGLVYRHWDFENTKDELGGNVRTAKSQIAMTLGLSIADTRTAVRIANVETTDATSVGKIADALYEAFAAIPREYRNSVEIYTTPAVILALRKTYANRVQPATYPDAIYRNAIGDILFDNFVIKQCDSMVDTEGVVA